jgi:hypothetical protein
VISLSGLVSAQHFQLIAIVLRRRRVLAATGDLEICLPGASSQIALRLHERMNCANRQMAAYNCQSKEMGGTQTLSASTCQLQVAVSA